MWFMYGLLAFRACCLLATCWNCCLWERRDTMQDDYGDALLGLLLMGAQGPDNVQHN